MYVHILRAIVESSARRRRRQQVLQEYHKEATRRFFDRFDVDRSNAIRAEELQEALEQLGRSATYDEARAMIRQVDESGSGEVNFEEFRSLLGPLAIAVAKDQERYLVVTADEALRELEHAYEELPKAFGEDFQRAMPRDDTSDDIPTFHR